MDLLAIKLLIMAGVLIFPFLISLIPMGLLNAARSTTDPSLRQKWKKRMSVLSCFAAGVFLGAAFLDLLPEVEEHANVAIEQWDAPFLDDFPIAELAISFGLIFLLGVEQITLAMRERPRLAILDSERQPLPTAATSNYNTLGQAQPISTGHRINQDRKALLSSSAPNGLGPSRNAFNLLTDHDSPSQSSHHSTDSESDDDAGQRHFRTRSEELEYYKQKNPTRPTQEVDTQSIRSEVSIHQDPNSHSKFRNFILLMALYLHSIFDGLAIGLQTDVNVMTRIFVAICVHKSVVAFSIGSRLVESRFSNWTIIKACLAFAATSPIGILIGIIISNVPNGAASASINFILQGLACGSFLFVTFLEILPHEFNRKHDRIVKFAALAVAYLLMVLIKLFFPHAHDHDHSDHHSMPCNSTIGSTTFSTTTTATTTAVAN